LQIFLKILGHKHDIKWNSRVKNKCLIYLGDFDFNNLPKKVTSILIYICLDKMCNYSVGKNSTGT